MRKPKRDNSARVAFTQREELTHETVWVKDELVKNMTKISVCFLPRWFHKRALYIKTVHNNLGLNNPLRSSDSEKPIKIMNVEKCPGYSYSKELNQKLNLMNL